MPSARDIAWSSLRLAGLDVTPVAPGAVLVARRRRTANRGRRSPYRTVQLDERAAIITPRRIPRSRHWAIERETGGWLARQHLRHIIATYDVNCVLDVGANVGQYGKLLRDIGYRGHIVSFEPVPKVFQRLARAARRDKRWDVHQMALGRESGSLDMYVVPGTCSSALPASDYGRSRFQSLTQATQLPVPVRRLDEVLDEVIPDALDEPRLLLKLDTQGYDLEAFAGLGDRSERVVALQSEVAQLTIYDGMPTMRESLDVFGSAGFEISGMFPVTRDPGTYRVLEFDCVMVRASQLPQRKPAGPPG